MQSFTPAQAEEALTHLTQHFAQWRQSRRTPRGRIPAGLWARAVALTATFSVSRVAKQLGLTPQALKRQRDTLNGILAPAALSSSPPFVEVATPLANTSDGSGSPPPRWHPNAYHVP
jgi:hypothetical protein